MPLGKEPIHLLNKKAHLLLHATGRMGSTYLYEQPL